MKTRSNQPTPNEMRWAIVAQVQKFQEMSKEISFISPAGCKLSNVINSQSLKNIALKTRIICGHWGKRKKCEDIEEMLKMAESIRKSYVNLIFRTNFIRDPEIQEKLDEVPLALAKIIKDYEINKIEKNVRVDNLGVNKEWKYRNSKCETCQMPFSQMKERNIPQRLWNKKLYCEECYDKVLVTEAKKNTTKQ